MGMRDGMPQGKQTFSGESRRKLGVQELLAAVPPKCAVATLVIAGAGGQKTPSPLWWGWVRWPGGEAMCCSLPIVVHASPL